MCSLYQGTLLCLELTLLLEKEALKNSVIIAEGFRTQLLEINNIYIVLQKLGIKKPGLFRYSWANDLLFVYTGAFATILNIWRTLVLNKLINNFTPSAKLVIQKKLLCLTIT